MEKEYPPDETIQLYHRSGSRLNVWSEKGGLAKMMVAHAIPPTRWNSQSEHQKIAQRVSHTNQREDQAAVVAPAESKEMEI